MMTEAEFDEFADEIVDLLGRFLRAKSRASPSGARLTGCLCHKPDGTVRRRMADRYLPMPHPDVMDEVIADCGWAVYDRREGRFLTTSEAIALPVKALMKERLSIH